MQEAGAAIIGAMKSPLKGNDGNVEFFLNLVVGEMTGPDVDDLLDRAVDERESR